MIAFRMAFRTSTLIELPSMALNFASLTQTCIWSQQKPCSRAHYFVVRYLPWDMIQGRDLRVKHGHSPLSR